MKECVDHLGRKIWIEDHPRRIISLVPSQTELLFSLGLNDEVIGITKFCVHPQKWFETKIKIGGTKNLNIEKIRSLSPDLIIANKEENEQAQIEELGKYFPVYVSNVNTLNDALQMIENVGSMTNKHQNSKVIIRKIKETFSQLQTINCKPKTIYLIWKNPYMTVGGDTFIAEMLRCCGFQNVYENEKRYPEISIEKLATLNCGLVLLSSEPYPFKQKHIDEVKAVLPNAKVILVDGEMFSWYGSRLVSAASYFEKLIHGLT